jgi:dolichol-phosphate mannosyltransferase
MLSAVVACYKDALAIPLLHARLSAALTQLPVSYEIIFVNDGSPDDTDSVLTELTSRDDHVLAVEHSRNFGSQNAFLSGMQLSTGDAVVLLDGDLQDPPELIPLFYAKWREGHDVVYGRRNQREGSRTFALLARLFYRIFRAASRVPMPLDAGDFALLDRRVVDELLALPETDQFLRGLRAWVGFRHTGVDYVRPERRFGRSTNGWLRHVWWAKNGIFSFSSAPIELLGYLATAMTLFSACAGVWQIIGTLRHPGLSSGISGVIVAIAFFGSLNLLGIALVGEYVVKALDETKRRPKFIRKAIRHRGQHFTQPSEFDAVLRSRTQARGARPLER